MLVAHGQTNHAWNRISSIAFYNVVPGSIDGRSLNNFTGVYNLTEYFISQLGIGASGRSLHSPNPPRWLNCGPK